MKYCPTCQTEFDEGIMRFCTKDGTPLIEKDEPSFTEMPSETSENLEDDDDFQTVIHRQETISSETTNLSTASVDKPKTENPERIVISTKPDEREQNIRVKTAVPPPLPPRKKSNTAVVVLMTILGTLVLIAATMGIYWFLNGQSDDNVNENINVNTDVNENLDNNFSADDLFDNDNTNTNENVDENLDSNSGINLNLDTPTPTPTSTPPPTSTPTKTPTPTPVGNANINSNAVIPNTNSAATPTPNVSTQTPPPLPTTAPTPRPSPPTNTNTPVNVGTINSRAISLPTPAYSPEARQAKASGKVLVSVTVDENGNVVSAKAVGGHPLLRKAAEFAAQRSRFRPVSVNGTPRKAIGTVVYNFIN